MWVSSIGQHIFANDMKLFRAAVFHGKQRHNDSVHLHALGLMLKVTFLHPALLLTLEKLTQSQRWHYNRSLYIRQWASLSTITSSYALRLLEQDVLRCYWSAALLNVYSSSPSPSLSYHALFDMYSETACILSVCPSYVTTKQNLLVYTHWNVPLLQDGPTSTVPCRRTSKWRGKTDAEHAPKSC